jgi:hypothetical protein
MVLLLGHGKLTQSEVNDAYEEYACQYPGQKLQIVYVGERIESVGEFALSGTGLTSIRFDPLSKVKTVQKGAFSANKALTELVLPPGLVHIPSMMCAECDSLSSIKIPLEVKTIGYRAFHEFMPCPPFPRWPKSPLS